MTAIDVSLDDSRTIQAIGILADVLDGISGPGVLDTVLVSKALRQVIATRSRPAFDFAARAFSTLDPELKQRVASDADAAAQDAVELRGRVAGFLNTTPRKKAGDSATGLLAALNNRGRGKTAG
ncbi:MAG: hypothetical protein GC191_12205 [Azospirillum sp.]|nr:hypothetical protein [Azospirillum sp.]